MGKLTLEIYPSTDLTGDFGRFEYIREVAAGGQGNVFIARLEAGQEVAVKAIRLELELDENERQQRVWQLEKEMATVKSLIHPNIVRHFSTAYNAKLRCQVELPWYYVTMELCRGTLAREAKRYPINGFFLQRWSKDILNGLAYLHANRIVHRDLKSDNIFLSVPDRETCVLKIGDLGDIKHLITSHQNNCESRGTFAHMSPEMIRGTLSSRHSIFQRTDIWSFGGVLIEMLTGELPRFINGYRGNQPIYYQGRGCEMPIMFYVGRGGRPEIQETWPDSVKDVIQSCLQGEPECRPTAEEVLKSAFIKGDHPAWDPVKAPMNRALSESDGYNAAVKQMKPEKDQTAYRIVKALAFGTFGMVYQVRMQDGSEAAIQLIAMTVDNSQGISSHLYLNSQVQRLRRQYQPLLGLNHQNVIRHFEMGINNDLTVAGGTAGNKRRSLIEIDQDVLRGCPSARKDWSELQQSPYFYISMELARGGTLFHAVRNNPVTGDLLYKWTNSIVSGLAYLHSHGIVHRALNTRNILVTSQDRQTCIVKIGGLCNSHPLAGPLTGSHEITVKKGRIVSPEVVNGSSKVGRKTDIWNVGQILIEMLTGRPPRFVQQDPDGQHRHILGPSEIMFFVGSGGRPEIKNTWPAGCRDVMDRCLQHLPADRPSAKELLSAIADLGSASFEA